MNKQSLNLLLNPRIIFYSIMIILCINNFSYITSPPYGDALTTQFWQAIWLLKNKWDYISLFKELNYYGAGPNNYYFSIVPLLNSLLYVFFKPTTVFFILHLLNIISASVIFTLFYKILKEIIPPSTAIILCAAALMNPVFNGQLISLNMEIFSALACSCSLYYFYHEKFLKSAIWVSIAIFIKFSAIILILAYAIWYLIKIFTFIFKKNVIQKKIKFSKQLFVFLPILLIPLFYLVKDNATISRLNYDVPFIKRFINHIFTYFPSLGFILILNILGIVKYIFQNKNFFAEKKQNYFSIIFIFVLFILGLLLSYSITISPLPRYITYIIFPSFCLFGFLWKNNNKLLLAVGLFLFLWGILNSEGRYFPKLKNNVSRAGGFLERSREYLLDLECKTRVCNFLEEYYFDRRLIVDRDFAFMLRLPEMGFVSKEFPNVYTNSNVAHYIGAKYIHDSKFDSLDDAIRIYIPAFRNFPEITDEDTIYLIDNSLKGWPVVVYKKNKHKKKKHKNT